MVVTREQRLIDTLVYLADTLGAVAGFDADELLHVLATRCVEMLDVDAAGVMLAMSPDELHAVAASSRDMRQLEIFEVAVAEGPSYDAFASGSLVVAYDLGAEDHRWPLLVPRALSMGFRAGYGFPLRLREHTVGALNLFQTGERPRLDEADALVAQGFADMAAIGLLHEELARGADERVQQLTYALHNRVVVEQAKGMVAERLTLNPVEALERLRKHARDRNRKLREVAQDVVDGRLSL